MKPAVMGLGKMIAAIVVDSGTYQSIREKFATAQRTGCPIGGIIFRCWWLC